MYFTLIDCDSTYTHTHGTQRNHLKSNLPSRTQFRKGNLLKKKSIYLDLDKTSALLELCYQIKLNRIFDLPKPLDVNIQYLTVTTHALQQISTFPLGANMTVFFDIFKLSLFFLEDCILTWKTNVAPPPPPPLPGPCPLAVAFCRPRTRSKAPPPPRPRLSPLLDEGPSVELRPKRSLVLSRMAATPSWPTRK